MGKMFYSNSDDYTREYYDSWMIEPRYVGAELADIHTEYFGETYDSPIMIAPMVAGKDPVEVSYAARDTNTLFFGAHITEAHISAMAAAGVSVVATAKPLADHEKICETIRMAEKAGAKAFFIDIDHIFSSKTGEYDHMPDGVLGKQTVKDLAEYATCSGLPVIIKGVLSTHDALLCKEAGIKAIAVSHHHGMLQYSVPPAMAVQNIRKAVGQEMTIFVDCGIESGIDAFKALALGADGVLVARHLMPYFKDGGYQAAAKRLSEMAKELRFYMNITGCPDLKHIDPAVLIRKDFQGLSKGYV